MVSHWVWRDYLGSDRGIVGRMIRLNGQGYTVAGMLAPGVEFARGAGFWYPLGVEKNVVERRGATFLQAIARVKPGVSHERVVAEVDALVQRLALEYPDIYPRSQRAIITPPIEYWTGSSRVHLWILFGPQFSYSVLPFPCARAWHRDRYARCPRGKPQANFDSTRG